MLNAPSRPRFQRVKGLTAAASAFVSSLPNAQVGVVHCRSAPFFSSTLLRDSRHARHGDDGDASDGDGAIERRTTNHW